MRRQVTFFLLILLITTALYVMLYFLAVNRLDPTVFVPNTDDLRHAKTAFSLTGFTIWLIVILGYAIACTWVFTKVFKTEKRNWSLLLLFMLSVLYVLLIHPSFMITVLPGSIGTNYSALLSRIPPLERIYSHWAILDYAPYLILFHTALAYAVVSLFGRKTTSLHRQNKFENPEPVKF